MSQPSVITIQNLIRHLAGRARYGFQGEKPLAVYSMLVAAESLDLRNQQALELLVRSQKTVQSIFTDVGRRFGKMKDPAASWSVIAGAQQELQKAILSVQGADEAFAKLGTEDLRELRLWFELNLNSPTSTKPEEAQTKEPRLSQARGDSWIIDDRSLPRRIQAWSNFRLPFEPKEDRRAYREALREALARLEAPAGAITRAEYAGPAGDDPFDLENILFYNVGAKAFGGGGDGRDSVRTTPERLSATIGRRSL